MLAVNRNQEDLKKLGMKIRELKTERNITDKAFSRLARIGASQVWRILEGQVNPTYSTLKAIAEVLEVHPGVFFDL
ncbi:helix-turn-helix protein [Chitinophaga polysaccharea]|uniref:Helix-turn-helix protein n=1 Tax=Chitinophaga polysaccharea TaxID=1293035 RepID=A0A561Q3D2_9BACT|nr:helix-turn-helix transcriptional regulator [Chitinophaga polysaccharea]TWF44836.1 helix-turn-helix protein [Chitinophaga polysaccharea]